MTWTENLKHSLQTENSIIREFLAEFLGTLVLVLFGCSSIAQAKLSRNELGSMLSINWSWGLGLTMGAFIAGNISGAHLNPAVSLAMFIMRKLKGLNRLFIYILAQYLGAFIGSALVFIVYYQALNNFDNGNRTLDTAGIWSSYPKPYLSFLGGFIDQIVSTMLLVLCIMAITDSKNQAPVAGLGPLLCGLVVVVIGMTFGLNCGYPINPARDLSPRLYTAIAGWGSEVFSYQNYIWFLVPVFGPHIGAILGALVYQLFVGNHIPSIKTKPINQRYFDEHNDESPLQETKFLASESMKRTGSSGQQLVRDPIISGYLMKQPKLTSISQEDFSAQRHREQVRSLRTNQSTTELDHNALNKAEQIQHLKASVDALRASIDALKV